jgi:transcriptional regulator with GAF, ATPase, and Fis domain/Tfp pilus assembly protein PilF
MPHTNPAVTESTPVGVPTEPRCFGRTGELARILGCWDRAQHGAGELVLVEGRHDIGKSTLLAEVKRQVRAQEALVLEACCSPGRRAYAPLLEVARQAWEMLCSSGEEDQLLDRAEQLLEVLGGKARSDDDAMHPAARRLQLFEHMAHLLGALSRRRPVMVLIHDVDLADLPTQQLLAFLARTLAATPELRSDHESLRGLVLASATRLPEVMAELVHGALSLTHIALGGLDVDGVRSFLTADEVVRRIADLTGGDPGKLDKLVRTGSVAQGSRPLDDLTATQRQLLQVIAVFGRAVGPETLRLLTGVPLAELGRAIASLTRRRLLCKQTVNGELRLGFTRAGDQQAVYEALDGVSCRDLHAAVGAYLEQRGESELELRATHLLRGNDPEAALPVVLAAGRRLEHTLCFERAAELYEQALPLSPGEPDELELRTRLCQLYQVTGQLDRALAHALRCRELEPDRTAATLRVVDLHLLRRDHAAAGRELEALEGSPAEHEAEILALAARAHYAAGERDLALAATERGLAAPRSSVRVRLSLQNTHGHLLLERGEHDQACSLFLENLEQARAGGLREEAALAMIQLGLIGLEAGDLDLAERWYQQALEQVSSLGEHRLRGACLQHLGVVAERRCRYDEALAHYQQAVGVWKQAWLRSYLGWVAVDLGKLYHKLGHLERARAMAELSDRLAEVEPSAQLRINRATLRARIARQECRYSDAESCLDQAWKLAVETGSGEQERAVLLERADLSLEQDRPEQTLDQLGAGGDGYTQIRTHLLRGRALLSLDRSAEARAELSEALEQADRLAHPETAWQAAFLLSVVAAKEQREVDSRRLLARAETLEARVRAHVPPELRERIAAEPLRRALAEAAQQKGTRQRPRRRRRRGPNRLGAMVGCHPRMEQLFAHVDRVAPTDALVLIRGESGTGKELVADAIHRRSRRAARPLVKVNCAALVESLLLSELFGHERGAFTGATERRKGRFEVADGGTIFLDEIGDISPATQVALLRVLQHQEFERVGGTTQIKVDVRIICATNRNLEQMVADGAFREDLYYRLKGFVIDVPALRQRPEDVPLLTEHFLELLAREREVSKRELSDDALRLLTGYGWPGNVRELENLLRSVSLLSDSEVLDTDDFGDYPELGTLRRGEDVAAELSPYQQIRQQGMGLREFKKQIEHECILEALSEAEGSITGAARLLGIKRPRLSQLVKEYGISVR